MLHRTVLFLLVILLMSCSVERFSITLDKATVRFVDRSTLFPDFAATSTDHQTWQALQLDFSSNTDLLDYIKSKGLLVQFRCSVTGNTSRKSYRSYGVGPISIAQDPLKDRDERHHYTAYSFIDLRASSVEYKNGKPESEMDLKNDHFESLDCHVIGVDKAPVPFPKSNDISVSFTVFHELLQQGQRQ